jgi:hypothetical protein
MFAFVTMTLKSPSLPFQGSMRWHLSGTSTKTLATVAPLGSATRLGYAAMHTGVCSEVDYHWPAMWIASIRDSDNT